MKAIKRIAVIGPESSGKSSLCEALAFHYKTNWVKEYAREYLPKLSHKYTIDDIEIIYREQFLKEQQLTLSSNNFIFTDTEFIIAKVWCEHAFNFCPDYIEDMIRTYPYDLYLLTYPDLPWEFDVLRENPGKGLFFFNWYEKLLKNYNLNYGIVSGLNSQRTLNAIKITDQFFSEKVGN